jgi:hypothetical protein
MLKHFKKGFSGDYVIKTSPGKLCMLCELEWFTFGVIWPSKVPLKVPLELHTVRAVYQVLIGNPRFPDQFPYLNYWLQLTQTMPP